MGDALQHGFSGLHAIPVQSPKLNRHVDIGNLLHRIGKVFGDGPNAIMVLTGRAPMQDTGIANPAISFSGCLEPLPHLKPEFN